MTSLAVLLCLALAAFGALGVVAPRRLLAGVRGLQSARGIWIARGDPAAARCGRVTASGGLWHAPAMRASLAAILAVAPLLASPAGAHGPSVRLSYGEVKPEKIAIRAGDTVHFRNASSTPRTFTLRAEDGAFESPPLARGDDWHHEFSQAGRWRYLVVEYPDMRGEVLVAPRAE